MPEDYDERFIDKQIKAARGTACAQDNANALLRRLRQLWKGTIYTSIYGLYVLFVGSIFVLSDWRAGVLAFFVITVIHPLRYIVNGVDKIAWEVKTKNVVNAGDVLSYQRRLYWGLYAAIQVCNLFLVGETYFLTKHWFCVLGAVVLFVVTEFLFVQVQSLNRKIEYTWANYGAS